jgi:DNA-binding response OmpR family regulator
MNKLIMVIDDSSTVRKIIETALGREGFKVVSFPDGIEAMRWLAQPDAPVPDVITLDIGLPKLDGYEVARRLKAQPQFSQTVILMISRRDGIIDRLKSRLAGAKEHISKPFKAHDLIAAVQASVGVPAPS